VLAFLTKTVGIIFLIGLLGVVVIFSPIF